jgi:hypothetical protein
MGGWELPAARAQVIAWVYGPARRARLAWRARLARWRAELLVFGGAAGMLGGAAIVGWWLLGLTLMAESGFAVWLGLSSDDGTARPLRGARTVGQVLDDERLRP